MVNNISKILKKSISEIKKDYLIDNNYKIDSKEIYPMKDDSNCIFIDGGQADVIVTPSFIVSIVKIVALEIPSKKIYEDAGIILLTNPTNPFARFYSFESDEIEEFKLKKTNSDEFISKKICEVRRKLELKMAERFRNHKYVFIDGDLDDIYPTISIDQKNVTGISKKSTLTNEEGISLNAIANINMKNKMFFSYVCSNDLIKTYICRLYPSSQYVFRVDTLDESVFDYLASISTDPVFLGYPFWMIRVDKLARISLQEKRKWYHKIKYSFGEEWGLVEKYMNSLNAHDILDSMGF